MSIGRDPSVIVIACLEGAGCLPVSGSDPTGLSPRFPVDRESSHPGSRCRCKGEDHEKRILRFSIGQRR